MTEVRLITHHLVDDLKRLSETATSIYWMTAFVMTSGVKLVLPHLKEAIANGCEVKLLVGDYLYITQPDAIDMLYRELPGIELRLFQSSGQSFHPKAYLFRGERSNHVIVGSSNLSKSALTAGIEWSLHVPTPLEDDLFNIAAEEFMRQFYEERTISLNAETLGIYREKHILHNQVTPFSSLWSEQEEQEVMYWSPTEQAIVADPPSTYEVGTSLTPRPAQVLALKALLESMDEDYDKALAVMATGLGKTYLAAFFAEHFKKVLFIAHREEILIQAKDSFSHVHPSKSAGFYHAKERSLTTDFLFASVQTLTQKHHLDQFDPEAFDLIVVDEFHHATAPSYMRIIEHFTPKFLLGITATPHRLDNKDVFAICDGNVAISIQFLDAIQKQWLAPFKYHGVYDDTDYSQLRWIGSHYDEEQLARVQLRTEMAEKILREWEDKKQSRTIAFCSSIRQSNFLNEHFQATGYRSISLNGATRNDERLLARENLNRGELDIIFTVDLFNEGVDIPNVDTLLFVRPTESLAVFTQQIGRGLRLAEGKDHCVIIDLIGNYKNADVKWAVFSPEFIGQTNPRKIEEALPDGCYFDIDTEIIDLLGFMAKKNMRRKEFLIHQYHELKKELGHRPSYLEFHLQSGADSAMVKREFGTYFNLLKDSGELDENETKALEDYQNWFLEVERTGMTKSYKMVLLRFMLTRGVDEWFLPVQAKDAAKSFHHYLTDKAYRKKIDFSDKQGRELEEFNEMKIASLIQTMPMTKWSGSSNGLVIYADKLFKLNFDIAEEHRSIAYEWTRQICEYRLHTYFEKKSAPRL